MSALVLTLFALIASACSSYADPRLIGVQNGTYTTTWTRMSGTCTVRFDGTVHVTAHEHAAPDGARGVVVEHVGLRTWTADYAATWDVRGTMALSERVTWGLMTEATGTGHAVIESDGERCEGDYYIFIEPAP